MTFSDRVDATADRFAAAFVEAGVVSPALAEALAGSYLNFLKEVVEASDESGQRLVGAAA